MARPLRIEYPDAFYHVTSRGNERKPVYRSVGDREQFLSYLESATRRYRARVHCYCLMSNRYHLLLETPNGNLSQIMRHVNGAYTTYFNVKRERAGHLFQGRYKAILVDRDEYAVELSRYIHRNPVRAGMVAIAAEYPWSSFPAYAGRTPAPPWLERGLILASFGWEDAETRYQDFVDNCVSEQPSPLEKVVGSTILGGGSFVEWVQETFLAKRTKHRELPATRALSGAATPEQIEAAAKELLPGDAAAARKAAIYVSHRGSGRPLKEIGAHFGLGLSGVTQASRRFENELKADKELAAVVDQIAGWLEARGKERS